jgi:hypothetical protein
MSTRLQHEQERANTLLIAEREAQRAGFALGVFLIGLGLIFLVGYLFDIRVEHYNWPFLVLVPGILLFGLGLFLSGSIGEAVAIVGSVTTMVGLLFFYQNTTGHWESWAYAWALVAPTGIGLGQVGYGLLKGQSASVKSGVRLVGLGLAIFVVAGAFFELIVGFSGFGIGIMGWALLLIGLGLLLLLRGFFTPHQTS